MHVRERLKESLWLWPLVFIVGGLVLSQITGLIDEDVHRGDNASTLFTESVDDARTVVSTIASSMLTFLGVVFSITLVALQTSSSQYSPRVVRRFVRSRTTKLTLATFLGTYVYCLIVLGSFQSASTDNGRAYVPVVSVLVAEIAALVCLLMFVAFVHNTVQSMRVTFLIKNVSDETRTSIIANTVPDAYAAEVDPRSLGDPHDVVCFDHSPGVLDGVEVDRLLQLAGQHDVVLRLVPMVGTYLSSGTALLEVYGTSTPPLRAILACFDIEAERTLYQDTSYGIRQLVDVAIRALSPAVNDPTTAVQVIDRLEDLLLRIGQKADRSNAVTDANGTVRLVFPRPTWANITELAFTELRIYGATAPQVTRRLIAVFDELERRLPDHAADDVKRHRALLMAAVERLILDDNERLVALTPDPRGLG